MALCRHSHSLHSNSHALLVAGRSHTKLSRRVSTVSTACNLIQASSFAWGHPWPVTPHPRQSTSLPAAAVEPVRLCPALNTQTVEPFCGFYLRSEAYLGNEAIMYTVDLPRVCPAQAPRALCSPDFNRVTLQYALNGAASSGAPLFTPRMTRTSCVCCSAQRLDERSHR